MGKRNLPTPPKTLGRQEWSVLSSWPEEESWAEELLTGKTTDGHSRLYCTRRKLYFFKVTTIYNRIRTRVHVQHQIYLILKITKQHIFNVIFENSKAE